MTELRSAKAEYRLYYQGQFCFAPRCRDLDDALGQAKARKFTEKPRFVYFYDSGVWSPVAATALDRAWRDFTNRRN